VRLVPQVLWEVQSEEVAEGDRALPRQETVAPDLTAPATRLVQAEARPARVAEALELVRPVTARLAQVATPEQTDRREY
jgi:hypothetical protein